MVLGSPLQVGLTQPITLRINSLRVLEALMDSKLKPK